MNALTATMTGTHETVEDLIRYAAHRFAAAGLEFRPAKMSKVIRRVASLDLARDAIDAYLVKEIKRLGDRDVSWRGFELFVHGYADPTGAHAARNLDLEDAGTRLGQQWAEARHDFA